MASVRTWPKMDRNHHFDPVNALETSGWHDFDTSIIVIIVSSKGPTDAEIMDIGVSSSRRVDFHRFSACFAIHSSIEQVLAWILKENHCSRLLRFNYESIFIVCFVLDT